MQAERLEPGHRPRSANGSGSGFCRWVLNAAATRRTERSSRPDLRRSPVAGPTNLDHGNALEHGLTGSPPVSAGLAPAFRSFPARLRDSPNCNRANAAPNVAAYSGRGSYWPRTMRRWPSSCETCLRQSSTWSPSWLIGRRSSLLPRPPIQMWLSPPALDGIAATAALLAKQPDVCVVLVTVQDEPRAGGARPSQRCSRLRRQAPRRPRAGARGKGSTAGRTLRVGIQAERQELRSCPEFSWPCGQAPAAGRVLSSRVRRYRWPAVLGTDLAGL